MKPEITLKKHKLEIKQSADIFFRRLEMDGILQGVLKLSPPGLPNPNGDEVVDLHLPEHLRAARVEEVMTLPKVLVTNLDLNWLQTVGEGWASLLKGFMRGGTLLEVLHFNSFLDDPCAYQLRDLQRIPSRRSGVNERAHHPELHGVHEVRDRVVESERRGADHPDGEVSVQKLGVIVHVILLLDLSHPHVYPPTSVSSRRT